MPRVITSAMLAALCAPGSEPVVFVQVGFSTGPAYLWSGVGPVTWNGQTWAGVGSLLAISQIEDGCTVEARGISITLSGFDPTVCAAVMADFQLGLPAVVLLGAYSDGSIIASPVTAWAGRTDTPELSVDGKTATVSINCESRLVDMNNPSERRYTMDDQTMTWPGDIAFMFVNSLQEITLSLPNQAPAAKNI